MSYQSRQPSLVHKLRLAERGQMNRADKHHSLKDSSNCSVVLSAPWAQGWILPQVCPTEERLQGKVRSCGWHTELGKKGITLSLKAGLSSL